MVHTLAVLLLMLLLLAVAQKYWQFKLTCLSPSHLPWLPVSLTWSPLFMPITVSLLSC
jgi:hypothetical protein